MKNILVLFFAIFLLNGCATWQGVKKDSSDAWDTTKKTTKDAYKSTKKAIHDATAE